MVHQCSKCGKEFTRKYTRDLHFKRRHLQQTFLPLKKDYSCPLCQLSNVSTYFDNKKDLVEHVDNLHKDGLVYKEVKSALNRAITIFTKQIVSLQPLEQFVSDKKNVYDIVEVIKLELAKTESIKVSLIVKADYRIPSMVQTDDKQADVANEEQSVEKQTPLAEERDSFTLRTSAEHFHVNQTLNQVRSQVKTLLRSLYKREEDLLTRGSGWQFELLHSCSIEIVSLGNF